MKNKTKTFNIIEKKLFHFFNSYLHSFFQTHKTLNSEFANGIHRIVRI